MILLATYLNLALIDIAWEVAGNDLGSALSSWSGWGDTLDDGLCGTGGLSDTSSWSSGGSWLAVAWAAATLGASVASRASVGHDLIEGLIDLGRHLESGLIYFGCC